MRIALISCTSKKKQYKCTASELYSESPRFALSHKYAKKSCDKVYILSAKYGLISEDEIIEPYNETLKDKSTEERKKWSSKVLMDLQSKFSLESDEFLILAGTSYNKYLLPNINKYELPLKGKKLGEWIPELKALLGCESNVTLDDYCLSIHKIFNNMTRLYWEDINKLPFNNGIYIMFEKGEDYFGMDRIVRIGTHKADNRLKERLKNHFIRENADGSILRKNIGRALLHKVNDPYESVWELDTSKLQVREANKELINLEYEDKIEDKISEYLKENISFVCVQINEKSERLRFEEGIISTLNQSDSFISSVNWLGLDNTKEEIVNSGLWNVQGLKGNLLTQNDINYLKELNNIGESLKSYFKLENRDVKSNIGNSNNSSKLVIKQKETNKDNLKVSTAQIKDFIKQILNEAKETGCEYMDIVSGDIHKKMNLSNKMPSVCSAMYQLKKENDDILHTTESGKSSTIKIRYYLKNNI